MARVCLRTHWGSDVSITCDVAMIPGWPLFAACPYELTNTFSRVADSEQLYSHYRQKAGGRGDQNDAVFLRDARPSAISHVLDLHQSPFHRWSILGQKGGLSMSRMCDSHVPQCRTMPAALGTAPAVSSTRRYSRQKNRESTTTSHRSLPNLRTF